MKGFTFPVQLHRKTVSFDLAIKILKSLERAFVMEVWLPML